MWEQRPRWGRLKASLGLVCLLASMLLLSPGVRVVRADENQALEPGEPLPAQEKRVEIALDRADIGRIETAPDAVVPSARAIRSDTIVLNTRGYNYGPNRPTARPRIQPAAEPAPAAPAPVPAPRRPGD